MKIRKTFKFKLKPTKAQVGIFRRVVGASRWVWNEMLSRRKTAYEEDRKTLSVNELSRQLTLLKKKKETEWLADAPAQVLQQSLRSLDQAFTNFFEKRAGYPKFKSKKYSNQSFKYPQGINIRDNQIYLPKTGWIRFRKSREIEGEIKQVVVKQQASGWYVCVFCEVKIDQVSVKATNENTIGIDLGLKKFLVTSNGNKIDCPKYYRKLEKKISKEQRKLSRKKRGSNRYRKQRKRLALLYERVRDNRLDFLHKLSHQLVTENQGIVAEDLGVKEMAKTWLSKSVLDAGWGEFLRQLDYKCLWRSKIFHKIDRWFPSTRKHYSCGTLNDVSLSDGREFTCNGCGKKVDRDLNAAKNIKDKGLLELNIVPAGHTETLNARGEAVRLA